MTTFSFCSNMAQRLENFVALRRLSGTDYQSQTRLLGYFDNFLAKEHFNEPCLNREIVQRYLSTLLHLHPRTQYNRFSVISQFCRYLSRFESFCYTRLSPLARLNRKLPGYRIYLLKRKSGICLLKQLSYSHNTPFGLIPIALSLACFTPQVYESVKHWP